MNPKKNVIAWMVVSIVFSLALYFQQIIKGVWQFSFVAFGLVLVFGVLFSALIAGLVYFYCALQEARLQTRRGWVLDKLASMDMSVNLAFAKEVGIFRDGKIQLSVERMRKFPAESLGKLVESLLNTLKPGDERAEQCKTLANLLSLMNDPEYTRLFLGAMKRHDGMIPTIIREYRDNLSQERVETAKKLWMQKAIALCK